MLAHCYHRHDRQVHLFNRQQRRNTAKHSYWNHQRGKYQAHLHHTVWNSNKEKKTCIAAIYCIITGILFFDDILPFLPCAILDLLLLIALIVVAVILGKPLSYLKCSSLSSLGFKDATVYAFSSRLSNVVAGISGKIDFSSWIGASKTICLETKAIWGLSIALW